MINEFFIFITLWIYGFHNVADRRWSHPRYCRSIPLAGGGYMTIPESIPQDSEEYQEMSPADFLRDLSNRIMHIPVMHGIDQYHADRLNEIARDIETTKGEDQ